MRLDVIVAAGVMLVPSGLLGQQLNRPVSAEAPPPVVEPEQSATVTVVEPGQPAAALPGPPAAAAPVYILMDPSMLRRSLPYEEGQPIPPGYTVRKRLNLGLLISGSVTFGVTYLTVVLLAAYYNGICTDTDEDELFFDRPTCDSAVSAAFIPLFGPFIAASAVDEDLVPAMFVFLGIAQLSGVVMLGVAAGKKRLVLVRNDLAEVHFVPLAYDGELRGMAVAGAF